MWFSKNNSIILVYHKFFRLKIDFENFLQLFSKYCKNINVIGRKFVKVLVKSGNLWYNINIIYCKINIIYYKGW